MSARVISVNAGRPVAASWAPPLGMTSISKTPRLGPTRVDELGVAGDQVADTKHHGGVDQAVYAFAREDLDVWSERLGTPLPDGRFGENLTTQGIDVNEALIGERWRVGTVELEVVNVRIPCNVFKGWMGANGIDNKAWVRRFTHEGRPGPYLRVRVPGVLEAGDDLTVVQRPNHDVTVTMMFRAFTTERELIPALLAAREVLAPKVLAEVEQYVDRAATTA
ncbi:MAG: MOSC domain-containing protein [Nocardioidaceae bacterium]